MGTLKMLLKYPHPDVDIGDLGIYIGVRALQKYELFYFLLQYYDYGLFKSIIYTNSSAVMIPSIRPSLMSKTLNCLLVPGLSTENPPHSIISSKVSPGTFSAAKFELILVKISTIPTKIYGKEFTDLFRSTDTPLV